ncbi:MAG: hypothetical protein ACREFZ_08895 [Acetobacteraceae bacterium]
MSAFLVPRAHIAALTRAAVAQALCHPDNTVPIASMLACANIWSVTYRYAGDHGATEDDLRVYTRAEIEEAPVLVGAELVGAINCLIYQSCEPPEWDASEAKAFLLRMRTRAASSANVAPDTTVRSVWPLGKR